MKALVLRFWATPPIHGCMRETVVHPGNFIFKLAAGPVFGRNGYGSAQKVIAESVSS